MTTRRRLPEPHLRSRPPIVLDPPPAYLSQIPGRALLATSPDRVPACDRILAALRARGIYARPTLAEIEAERTRRGLRPTGVEIRETPVVSEVLPMPGRDPSEARTNRERLAAAFAGIADGFAGFDEEAA